ncbi:transcriptional regulator [Candidatus Bathyarchaeota archaeon]|nr:MAG: transcriptional regulator [Candidatus Bathyarchaeota archaeon]
MPKRNNLEQDALQIIIDMGSKGVLQSELWRKINASSREGSRISIKLESKGLIYRERELHKGRWTYRLFSKRKPVSIDSIITCPCLTCPESSKCEAGGAISPNNCEKLTQWILESAEGKNPSR